ncbi:MAG TPA: response regulator transcription factor [Chthoniobacteraceae bacterium]|jgi:DNA-binding NarL/FixJ family response regulator|nr:response regulator transcription factor [Chthoniobacteraceae bacterium]
MTESNPAAPGASEKSAPLKVLVVDDHPLVRRGIVETICEALANTVVGEASNSQGGLEMVWKEHWDVIVIDIAMPGRSGLDLLKDIRHERPKTPVLVLSTYSEDQFAIRTLRSGADGYLTKDVVELELVSAIKRLLAGGKYIRASLAEKLASHLDVNANKPPHQSLSDREYQVMRMIASGQTPKEIAAELCLSIKTVSTFRSRILKKMAMKNNAEVMRYAMENGLVKAPDPAQPGGM